VVSASDQLGAAGDGVADLAASPQSPHTVEETGVVGSSDEWQGLAVPVVVAGPSRRRRGYRRAGRHALEQQTTSGWCQLYIQFTDCNTAEQAAADHLAPLLHHAEDDGTWPPWLPCPHDDRADQDSDRARPAGRTRRRIDPGITAR
jgi:hypothetical protein